MTRSRGRTLRGKKGVVERARANVMRAVGGRRREGSMVGDDGWREEGGQSSGRKARDGGEGVRAVGT